VWVEKYKRGKEENLRVEIIVHIKKSGTRNLEPGTSADADLIIH
jgi:hypothetical protein